VGKLVYGGGVWSRAGHFWCLDRDPLRRIKTELSYGK
jgi:hypothetical protein